MIQRTLSLALTSVFSVASVASTITLKNAKGESVGSATLTQVAKGLKINLDVHGLPPGEHAFHVHEKPSCVAPKFESAGGHFNPTKQDHGFDSAKGYHAGDMANVVVEADGHAKVEIINTALSLEMLKGGAALMIHEKADDYKSQPAGNAGARLACGEIKP